MKSKLIILFAAFALTGLIFTGCSDDDDDNIRVESVELNDTLKDGVDLFVGETLNIAGKVTVKPANATNKKESYSSSKTDVATVSEAGLVTAVAAGTSEITITVDGKSAKFNLTVSESEIPVESVEIDGELKEGVTLSINQTLNIAGKVTVLPANASNKREQYSSSNTDVATVSEAGLVTAVAAGNSDITISVDGKSDKFVLTVTEDEIPVTVTEVRISLENIKLIGDQSRNIADHITVLPEDAENKAVTYSTGNAAVAEVDENGKISGVGEGNAVITITSVDNPNASATIDVAVALSGDYDRTGWVISDHHPILFVPTEASGEKNTTEFLFEDSNTDGSTFFALVKVGSSWTATEPRITNDANDGWMHFTIDTQQEHKVNYFRFAYRPGSNLEHLRYKAIERIYGSNDGETFEDITTEVTDIPNFNNYTTNISDNAVIPTSNYRYYKFWCKQMGGVCFSVAGGASGCVRKIWMGYDPALE